MLCHCARSLVQTMKIWEIILFTLPLVDKFHIIFSLFKETINIFLTVKQQQTIDISTKARPEPGPDTKPGNTTSYKQSPYVAVWTRKPEEYKDVPFTF